MSDFKYTTVPGKIPSLLDKIREVGVPSKKVTLDWLKSIGFASSNDRSLLRVLEQAGFVDSSGVPGETWKQYRGANHKGVLAAAITKGYADLYATYPDAHNRPNADLESFFSTHTSAGKQVVEKMVATFKGLCQKADFGAAEAGVVDLPTGGPMKATTTTHGSGTGVTININIELTLPETSDEDVYNNFFRAMREHLIGEPGK